MEALQKLQLLGPAAAYEPAEEVNMLGERAPLPQTPDELAGCISHATLPGGKRVPMLKTLVSSACERDCRYCPFRAGRDFRRATFTPDELANFTAQIYRQGLVQGVFLSSAILGGGPHTQDRIIATAELLRRKYHFTGYLHVKVMPGAERDQISATMQYADRVSVNLEAPNARRLADLAPHKHFSEELFQRLRWIHELRQSLPVRRPSITTQFVVGAVGETDVELLMTSAYLYRELGLARAYFSGFSPVENTPLEHNPPIQLHREHRLYQASFLLRDYGFDVEELPFTQDGNLPLYEDPKTAWANLHLSQAPVELNTADREMLLRVPGIGPIGADRIIHARRQGTLRFLSDLSKLGIATKRAAPYILLNGQRSPRQLTFWTG
ncbi:MAG TPA: radical SAM protein [Anaerolineae bacterium]|nr:radical SAM protein [Anaerolineae bacterium]HQK15316.1 radical SAM protein [Anaerolineae bacterium]